MLIDFNKIDSMTFPGMDNGTGTMSARMYNDDSYRIIPTSIHPGGSIGTHKQNSGDEIIDLISHCDGYYQMFKDYYYVAKGNISDIFRVIQYGDELILLELYICD